VKYPTVDPATAAITKTSTKVKIGKSMYLLLANNPAVNTSESPGRKKPKKTPVSINITDNKRAIPPHCIMASGFHRSMNNRIFSNMIGYQLKQVVNYETVLKR